MSGEESRSSSTSCASWIDQIVARNFDVYDSELSIGGVLISELASSYGTPLYIYDAGIVRERVRALRDTYGAETSIHYSMKANPARAILQLLHGEGCGIEVASAGEIQQAIHAGVDPADILFAGPGKRDDELQLALELGLSEIHVESVSEAQRLNTIAANLGLVAPIALRINPSEAVQGGAMRMGGTSSPFGIDEESLDDALDVILRCEALSINGVHLFTGTQILDAETLLAQHQRAVDIAARIARTIQRPLRTIDFGGGLGIPYFQKETPLDLSLLRKRMPSLLSKVRSEPLLRNCRIVIEPGRYLVGEAGLYLTSVIDTKRSRGTQFVILDGGMHHHLAASGNLGQTIKRNFPIVPATQLNAVDTQKANLVGPLCTPLDTLGRNVEMPPLVPGELIAVLQSGAYGRTSSPLQFLSHNAPAEVLVDDGQARLIRQRGALEDFLKDQVTSDPITADCLTQAVNTVQRSEEHTWSM